MQMRRCTAKGPAKGHTAGTQTQPLGCEASSHIFNWHSEQWQLARVSEPQSYTALTVTSGALEKGLKVQGSLGMSEGLTAEQGPPPTRRGSSFSS